MIALARSASTAALATALALTLAGCPGEMMVPADSGRSMDSGPLPDGITVDGGLDVCDTASDCDDGVFCNGAERCAPGTTGAGPDGCATATDEPCIPESQRCDEAMSRCVSLSCEGSAGDADGDGERSIDCGGLDCDDADSNRSPARSEFCDGANRDEDCNPTTFGFRDADADGASDAACCNAEADGTMHCGVDCNDAAPDVRPGATEACNGVDDDCQGGVDEGVLVTFYVDADGDNYGAVGGSTVTGCFVPSGYASMDTDCNDAVSSVHPGAVEICDATPDGGTPVDENCDMVANPASDCMCELGQSRSCARPGICAAGTEMCMGGTWGSCSIAPTVEVCDYEDDDCNGVVDDGLQVECYVDSDNDGYPANGAAMLDRCPAAGRESVGGCPAYYTNRAPFGGSIDCDDGATDVRPGTPEVCDAAGTPRDENCNGSIDEGVAQTCFADGDGDGFALSGAAPVQRCIDSGRPDGCPFGSTARAPASPPTTDCNDTAAGSHPGLPEACDGMLDEDCDSRVDESCGCTPPGSMRACTQSGVCANGQQTCVAGNWGSCSIAPSSETCNMLDDNCNGTVDEGVRQTCYVDADDDRYAPAGATGVSLCTEASRPGGCPFGYTERAPSSGSFIDCNDAVASAHPGGTEVCEGSVDENCLSGVDEGCTCTNGMMRACPLFGVCGNGTQTCAGGNWGTCSISPTSESCNSLDDDCDDTTDEGTGTLCYPDSDNDGYALSGSTPTRRCAGCGPGTTSRVPSSMAQADCNDTSAASHPGLPEVCDGTLDENCNGTTDEGCICVNGSTRSCPQPGVCGNGIQSCSAGGWSACSIMPTAEACNTLDDNCNGSVDEGVQTTCWIDADGDSYALASASSVMICGLCGSGYTNRSPTTAANRDCDDTRNPVHPGATETCDGRDTDCSSGAATAVTAEDNDGDSHTAIGYAGCTGGFVADDCNDFESRAYPGQLTYFPTGYCPVGSGLCPDCNRCVTSSGICGSSCSGTVPFVFDFNCDGSSTREPTGTNNCAGGGTCFSFPGCATSHYYYTGAPTCGSSTPYWTCGCAGISCTAGTLGTRGMACR